MIIKTKKGSKTNRKGKVDDYCLRRALARLPSASSAARPVVAARHASGVCADWEKKI
jgi:hypothetical protein